MVFLHCLQISMAYSFFMDLDLQDNGSYEALLNRGVKRSYKAGDIISLQDDLPSGVSYILSGRAKAISYSDKGDATWVGYFEAQDFFGHISLLTEQPVNFEISADTELDALIIPAAAMRSLLSEDKALSRAIAADLAARLDYMTRRLVEAFTLSAKGRVCAELVRLSNIIGTAPEKSIIRPSPVFVELAQRVNSTRETVSRTVSELQKKGIVSREPGALVIDRPERLKAAVQ